MSRKVKILDDLLHDIQTHTMKKIVGEKLTVKQTKAQYHEKGTI